VSVVAHSKISGVLFRAHSRAAIRDRVLALVRTTEEDRVPALALAVDTTMMIMAIMEDIEVGATVIIEEAITAHAVHTRDQSHLHPLYATLHPHQAAWAASLLPSRIPQASLASEGSATVIIIMALILILTGTGIDTKRAAQIRSDLKVSVRKMVLVCNYNDGHTIQFVNSCLGFEYCSRFVCLFVWS